MAGQRWQRVSEASNTNNARAEDEVEFSLVGGFGVFSERVATA